MWRMAKINHASGALLVPLHTPYATPRPHNFVDAGSSAGGGGGGGGSESALAHESAPNNILSAGMLRQHRSPVPSLQPVSRATAKYTSSSTDKKNDTVKLCFFKFRLRGFTNSKQSPHLAMPLVDISNVPNDAVNNTEGSGEVCNHYSVSSEKESTYTFSRHAIRSNYMDKSIEAKKKVIRMLFVVVGEFFICWTPIHILNTVYLFNPEFFRTYLGNYTYLVQILAYVSSCCNPITYCFMNRKFRQAFLSIFKCYQCARICCFCTGTAVDGPLGACSQLEEPGPSGQNNSELSGNDSTLYVGRGCRSEVVVLDGEERV
ncbi:hypothetical protein LSTR_LSTR006108 [Laodelphax striatellus]|uniref:G-protein coupled receptors family 1 profile domain-containing protein n=1 Tax=Laodelphax striatellus TaxID=195883 RepID=A0A482WYE3_LAOST|nr:hypothetical protein LSTR_LSTR006108 [Laodelphax striatellus]